MAMPDVVRKWTRDQVLALPDDGNRYELVAGELLGTPAPPSLHQDAVLALYDWVAPYVRRNRLGHVSVAPADLELRPGEIYQPDLFVVPLVDGRRPREWAEYRRPLLVVEVSSPGTARYDRVVKRPAYQDAGVAEYWIVDLDARLVERWRPDDARPEMLTERLEWCPAGAAEPLGLDLTAWFSELRD